MIKLSSKKHFRFLILILLFSVACNSQVWTWVAGTDSVFRPSYSGSVGVSSPSYNPGSLMDAMSWTDASGNFWLFGGFRTNVNVQVNDLWKFDVQAKTWAWYKGTVGGLGVYGTQNTPSSPNSPGSRIRGATWTDSNGDLWLFGGFGVATTTTQSYLNDLWKYSVSTNEWTWIGGANTISQYGTYGSMGTASVTNMPGARCYSCFWKDNSNNFWLYGGSGYAASTWGYIGDLWKYNTVSGLWTWVSGSSASYPAASFGTQGFPSSFNTPGARSSSGFWQDNSGNFWISGGNGVWSGFGTCTWGDLWRYNPATNQWTWMKGSNNPYLNVGYGTMGVGSSTTDVGMRTNPVCWTDNAGDLWLFGGGTINNSVQGLAGDLWKYSVTNNQWIWMGGPNTINAPRVMGTKNYPSAANQPGDRAQCASWKDLSGNMWLYGGFTSTTAPTYTWNTYTDLWRLSFCTTVPASPSGVSTSTNSLCGAASLTLSANSSSNPVFWFSSLSGNAIIATGTTAIVNTLGTGAQTLYAQSANECTVSSGSAVTVTVYSNPSITVNNGSLCLGQSYVILPTGAQTYSYSGGSATVSPLSNTSFTITGSSNGCSSNVAIIQLSVLAVPVLSLNSGTVCAGSAFTLSPSGASSYSFQGGSAVVFPALTSTYLVSGTGTNGCVGFANATVNTLPLPVITVNNGTLCQGDAFVMVPQGASTYTFSSGSPTVNPMNTTTYSVTGTDNLGCVTANAAVTTLTVMPSPVLTVTPSYSMICVGEIQTLTASGALTYSWSTGDTIQTVSISPSVVTSYTVEGTDNSGCRGSSVLVVTPDACTGIHDQDKSVNLTVFPNPFESKINFVCNTNCVIQIFDALGRTILIRDLVMGESMVELPESVKGVYILRCKKNDTMIVRKLIRD